ncbi:prominin-1-A-like [Argopecten irradians]|uniref:prominin-1-A-like n=1 Tax=Argopecten irradians TaxID=31199 RepID=UPI0037231361
MTIFISIRAGCIVSVISNEILHAKLRNEDNKGPVGMLEGSFDRLEEFAIDTVKEIEQAGSVTLDRTVSGVVSRIRDATNTTIDDVKKTINAEKLLTDAENLGTDASAVLRDLQNVTTTLEAIKDLNTKINETLTGVKTAVTTTCTDYGLSSGACPAINVDVGTDFTGIAGLSNEISKMSGAQGIINQTQTAREEFNKLQANLEREINNQINSAINQTNSITNEVSGQLNTVNETVQPFVDSINSNVAPQLIDLDSYLKEYGDYWWYAGIAIPCVVILLVIFYFMGIMFGTFGDRPGDGAQCCNKGAGSNLLVCGVVWSFLFASILMLIVLILFLLGGSMYGIVCREFNNGVENVQLYEPVVDEVLHIRISKLLYGDNAPANLTLGSILNDCKNNMALYTAVKLKHLFDLDSLLNTSAVTNEIDSVMGTALPSLGSINIIPTELQTQLDEFSNSGVDTINFDKYTTELNKSITTSPLNGAITSINTATTIEGTNLTAAQSLRNQSAVLQALEDDEVVNLTQQFNQLRAVVQHLETYTNIKNRTRDLINALNETQIIFNRNSTTIVSETLQVVMGNISTFVQREIDGVKSKIENEIGRCKPLYDATQQASNSLCLITLDPFVSCLFRIREDDIECSINGKLLISQIFEYNNFPPFSRDMEMYQGQAGYNAYGHQDNVPLTSMEAGYQKGRSRGVPNAGYDNGQPQDPYLRNGEGGYHYHGSDRPPSYHESGQYPMHGGYPVLPQQQKYY